MALKTEDLVEETLDDVLSDAIFDATEQDVADATKEEPEGLQPSGTIPIVSQVTSPDSSVIGVKPENQSSTGAEPPQEKPYEAPLMPPVSWNAEEKTRFASLPREVQATINRRELEQTRFLTQKAQEVSQLHKTWGAMGETLTPHMQKMQLAGVRPEQAVSRLLSWQEYLDSNPREAISALARTYGLNPQDITDENPIDPGLQSVQGQIEELQSQNAQLQEFIQTTVQQQQIGAIQQEISSFQNATDEKGSPLRPYFDYLKEEMEPIVGRLRATNPQASHSAILQAAYERAVWSNPQTRAAMMAANIPQQKVSPVQKAKRAGVSVVGSSGASMAPNIPDDLDAMLKEQLGMT